MHIHAVYDQALIGEVPDSTQAEVQAAIELAQSSALLTLTAKQRGAILNQVVVLIEREADALALLMAREAGKPIKATRGEVARAIETFGFAADVARDLHGETIPMDAAATGAGRLGFTMRVPIGVVAAITPFNFPLNLVAHKVAPALAAGAPLVLKPAPQTPLTAIRLAELVTEAGAPTGSLQIVTGGADVGEWLTTDPRVQMITFTGSPGVARAISKNAGLRRTVWELGGNAATIVDADADLSKAIPRCAMGSFAYSGQTCISIQRIYVHDSRYEEFRTGLISAARAQIVGDPLDPAVDLGPVINEQAAIRIENWVNEAVEQGARIVYGAPRQGLLYPPTILENVDPSMQVMCAEVFGPVVSLIPFTDLGEAIRGVNDSVFGLQAGIYTNNLAHTMQVIRELHVGGVMINDVPTFRVDQMPYGGVKDSGSGREGPRYAAEEMTVLKLVVFNG